MTVGNDFNESIWDMEVTHFKHWPIMKESICDSIVLKKMVNMLQYSCFLNWRQKQASQSLLGGCYIDIAYTLNCGVFK